LNSRALGAISFFLAGIAVALAALGAHLLEGRWHDEAAPGQYATATRILFWHSIGIWICSRPGSGMAACGWSMFISVILFCVPVYLLSLGAPSWLGMIAPLGGLGLIGSWFWMAWSQYRSSH